MRTLRIQEALDTSLDITLADAAVLQSLGRQLVSQRGPLSTDPTTERTAISCSMSADRVWSIRVDNAVGVIGFGDTQIVVEPKIPMAHLLFLLEQTGALPRTIETHTEMEATPDLLKLIARWFVRALEKLLKSDLAKDYSQETDVIGNLRGRVEVLRTSNLFYSGKLGFECEFDDFNRDSALNRVLKAGCYYVASSSANPSIRFRARQMLNHFDGVGQFKSADLAILPDRRTANYRDALVFAKCLLRNSGRSVLAGDYRGWTFLIPTAGHVESGLRSILNNYFAPVSRVVKFRRSIGGGFDINPDLIFESLATVGDIKYKVTDKLWNRNDLYQSVAFAVGFEAKNACIISFNAKAVNPPSEVRFGDVSVTSINWLAESHVAPRAAADQMCQDIAKWLDLPAALIQSLSARAFGETAAAL